MSAPVSPAGNYAVLGTLGVIFALGLLVVSLMVRSICFQMRIAWQQAKESRRWLPLAASTGAILVWPLLFLSSFNVPGAAGIVDMGLDFSWPLVIEHAAQQGWRWGHDVVFTFGPLGYLQPDLPSLGGFVSERVLYGLLHATFSAHLCWRCGITLPPLLRVAFWVWLLPYPPSDVLLCGMAGCVLASRSQESSRSAWVETVAIVSFVALLAMVKFTNFMAALAVVGLVTTYAAIQKRSQKVVVLPVFTGGAMLILWLASGQSLMDAPAYFRYSWQIAKGFNTMSYAPTGTILVWCLGIAGLLVLLTVMALWNACRRGMAHACPALLVAACAFVSWKHGLTRADSHVIQFLATAFPYACLLFGVMPLANLRQWALAAPLLVMVLGFPATANVIGGGSVPWQALGTSLVQAVPKFLAAVAGRLTLPTADDLSAEKRENWSLEGIRDDVGTRTVDVINFQQGYVFINQLNYRPRPVFQSYSSYTPTLQALNLDHYQSEARPDLVLFQMESVDNRLVWLDDAPLMMDLATSWSPRFREKGFLLLEKQEGVTGTWKEVVSDNVRWGKNVKLPVAEKPTLRALRVEARRSLRGRLKQFLYQGAQATLIVKTSDDAKVTRNFVPEMASYGVLLSPWMGNVDEFLTFKVGGQGRNVVSFSLAPWEGCDGEFQDKYSYAVVEWVPSKQGNHSPQAGPVHASMRPYPYLPAAPRSMRPAMEVRVVNGAEACCARAPTRLEFAIPPEAVGLKGRFMAECAPLVGEPEKVVVLVRVQGADGQELVRHEVAIFPQIEPKDAGEQFLDVQFPPATGAPRILVLESTTNMVRNRALSWWGPLTWKLSNP